jgi:hypothetical protein
MVEGMSLSVTLYLRCLSCSTFMVFTHSVNILSYKTNNTIFWLEKTQFWARFNHPINSHPVSIFLMLSSYSRGEIFLCDQPYDNGKAEKKRASGSKLKLYFVRMNEKKLNWKPAGSPIHRLNDNIPKETGRYDGFKWLGKGTTGRL